MIEGRTKAMYTWVTTSLILRKKMLLPLQFLTYNFKDYLTLCKVKITACSKSHLYRTVLKYVSDKGLGESVYTKCIQVQWNLYLVFIMRLNFPAWSHPFYRAPNLTGLKIHCVYSLPLGLWFPSFLFPWNATAPFFFFPPDTLSFIFLRLILF